MKWWLTLALTIHAIITAFALEHHKFLDFFPPFHERLTSQIFSDLTIAMALVLGFFYYERKTHQRPLTPWWICLVATVLLGSFAPLIYLLCGGYRLPGAKS